MRKGEAPVRLLTSKDFIAGLVFMTIGAAALIISQSYRIGTANQMGPGYFPMMLAGGLLLLGAVLAVKAWRDADPESMDGGKWRAVLFPTLGIVLFGLALERLGLILSIALVIGVGVLGSSQTRWKEVPFLILASIAFSVLVFVYGVKLPVEVWPQ